MSERTKEEEKQEAESNGFYREQHKRVAKSTGLQSLHLLIFKFPFPILNKNSILFSSTSKEWQDEVDIVYFGSPKRVLTKIEFLLSLFII